jgi:hypothetical protein
MTTSWMLQSNNRRPNENGRSDRRLAAERRRLPKLMTSAAMVGLFAVAIAAPDLMSASLAFAKSRTAQGNQGSGSRGLGSGGVDLPAAASINDARAEPSSRANPDLEDVTKGAIADTRVDFDLPVGERFDIGGSSDDFSRYLENIDYPGKTPVPGLPATAMGAEANGKAGGLRRKENLDADAPSAKEYGQKSSHLAIDPRFYSRHDVLAINLSSVATGQLRRLGFVHGTSAWIGGDTVTVLTVPSGMDALTALDRLQTELPGEHFQFDHLYRLYQPAMRDDVGKDQRTKPASMNGATQCLDDRCYPRTLIQWRDDLVACARKVRIGVIDTDVDLRHPTFRGQDITYKSFVPEGRSPSPDWHGTGVLALLAGRPDSGTPGLINEARFYVASIFHAGDDGQPVTNTVSLLHALDWMKASGVMLVNLSLAGMDDPLIRKRIAGLAREGLVFTAAAGNGGPAAEPSYPAAYPQVVAVTAISKRMQVFPFANRGPYIDLAAPGVDIWTAVPDSREGYRSGTSFAVPFATALLAIQQQNIQHLPKEQLLDHVEAVRLGAPGADSTYGRGLLQAPSQCPASVATVAKGSPILGVVAR